MMKKTGLILLTLIISAPALFADVFTNYDKLYEINTEHFKFIFSEESRDAAEYLASKAESIYAYVADLLDVPMDLHLPVVFTTASEMPNGYFSPLLENRIVLFNAALLPNDGFARYNNNLENLFLHELTHAVSLNSRSPFFKFISAIIGDLVSPAGLEASPAFVEGVTVSFESLDGYGRANQTEYAAQIQQDIIEGKFRSFHETAGLRDYPGGTWYIYGGWFSKYLQETYGMDRYAGFWKELGKLKQVRDILFFKGAFRAAYGIQLNEAWDDFRQWIQLKVPVITESVPLQDDYLSITAMTARGSKVYYAANSAVYVYDALERTHRKLMRAGYTDRLDVSADGRKLLLSTHTYRESYPVKLLLVYDLDNRTVLNKLKGGYAEAAFAGDSLLAVKLKSYSGDIVRIDGDSESILFSGTNTMIPSAPCLMRNGDVLFLLQKDGENSLARILPDMSVRILVPGQPVTGIKNIWSDGSRVLFVYDNDLTLYKLGSLEESGLELQTVPLSGGIQYPVSAGGKVIYTGFFSEGRKLMEFPRKNASLAMESAEYSWKNLEEKTLDNSVFPPASGNRFKTGDYNRLWNVLLPQFRLPYLALDLTGSTATDIFRGAGLVGMSEDPTEGLGLAWQFVYIWGSRFLHADVELTWDVLPVTVGVDLYDRYYFNMYPESGMDGRLIGASLSAYDTISFYPGNRAFSWMLDAASEIEGGGYAGTDAYSWTLGTIRFPFSVYSEYMDLQRARNRLNGKLGFLLGGGYSGVIDSAAPGWPEAYALGVFRLCLPVQNFRNDLYGVFSVHDQVRLTPGNVLLSNGSSYYSTFGYPAFYEYSGRTDLAGDFYLYGDAGFGPSLKIQQTILPLVYLMSIDLRSGYRYGFIDNTWLDAVYGRIIFKLNFDLGNISSVPFEIGFELSAPFRENNGPDLPWRIILNMPGIPGVSVDKRKKTIRE